MCIVGALKAHMTHWGQASARIHITDVWICFKKRWRPAEARLRKSLRENSPQKTCVSARFETPRRLAEARLREGLRENSSQKLYVSAWLKKMRRLAEARGGPP